MNEFKQCFIQSIYDPWTSIHFCRWLTTLFMHARQNFEGFDANKYFYVCNITDGYCRQSVNVSRD